MKSFETQSQKKKKKVYFGKMTVMFKNSRQQTNTLKHISKIYY